MTIVEFLTARYDEDEEIARYADGEDYWLDDGEDTGRFLEHHSPAHVLADIAAKRAILALHQPSRPADTWYWLERECGGCHDRWHKWVPDKRPTDIGPERGCPTLRHLASMYADHPDYLKEWKP